MLNFGLPAPIDVQVVGAERDGELRRRAKLASEIAQDSRRRGRARAAGDWTCPELRFNVDRIRAQQLGLTQRDVASNLLISLSSSGQTAPNFWLNPQNGVQLQRQRADAAVQAASRR